MIRTNFFNSALGLLAALAFYTSQPAFAADSHWIGTWATAAQLTEPRNMPPAPGLSSNTLRQVVHASIGGKRLRLKLSNQYGTEAVSLVSVHLAQSTGGSSIDAATDTVLAFHGNHSVTLQPGEEITSDDLAYDLSPFANLAVTIHFGNVSSALTGHPGSRATSYIQTGDAVTATNLPNAATTAHWYIITGIDVQTDHSGRAIITLGDSITDGRGSTTDGNDRWPDALARRLHTNAPTSGVSVLNMGIGGNTVLVGGLGPTASKRFDRDVLAQSGARWLILYEGVNDIGGSGSQAVATNLINAFTQFIEKAHAKNIKVYGVPILPFGGNQGYSSAAHETARQTVNDWIRTSGKFDAVIDLDAAVRDPANPANLLPKYDTNDHLHLNPAGYQAMADAIDLSLFK